MPFDNNRKPKPLTSLKFVAALSGAVLVGLSTLVATPAHALDPVTFAVTCDLPQGDPDVTADIPIYAGQDAVLTFTPATCEQVYWSELNPALTNNVGFSGTATFTVPAADILCDNEFEVVGAANSPYYFLTFTGCDAAPAPAPAAESLPKTGVDAAQIGVMVAGAGLLTLAGAALMIVRRRTI